MTKKQLEQKIKDLLNRNDIFRGSKLIIDYKQKELKQCRKSK